MMDKNFFVHETSYIDEGAVVGAGTRIWHFCHIREGSVVGQNCNIGQNVYIDQRVKIGDRVKIQNNVSIYNGVVIEDDVFIGPSVVFTNVTNPRSFVSRIKNIKPTFIGTGASLGANSTIVCGVEIGQFALVGAGSTVTKDIKPYALVIGIPARQSGWVSRRGVRLSFNENGIAVCPEEHISYIVENGNLSALGG